MNEQISEQMRGVIGSLKTDCLNMYINVLSRAEEILLLEEVAELTAEELTHIIRTLAMIKNDLRTLSKFPL